MAALLVVTSMVTTQCSKNKSLEHPTTSLLTAKTWIFDEVTVFDQNDPPQILYKRNRTTNYVDFSKAEAQFQADGTFLLKDFVNGDFQGKWKLLDDTKLQIVQDGTGDSEVFTDLSVSGSSLSMKQTDGSSYTIQKYIPKQ